MAVQPGRELQASCLAGQAAVTKIIKKWHNILVYS